MFELISTGVLIFALAFGGATAKHSMTTTGSSSTNSFAIDPPGNDPAIDPPGNGPAIDPPGNGPAIDPPGN
jgi:hypothetical protein